MSEIPLSAIIEERERLTVLLEAIRNEGTRPEVTGFTYDEDGTGFCEQGLSFCDKDCPPTIGLHVIDVGLFEAGGVIDRSAYVKQHELAGQVSKSSTRRLFPDWHLYKKLTLHANQAGDEPVPVISFIFQPVDGRLAVVSAERSLFRTKRSFGFSEDPTIPGTALGRLVDVCRVYMDRPDIDLRVCERQLCLRATRYVEKELQNLGVPMIKGRNRKAVSLFAPLRHWTDLKNLQFFASVLDGELPLYDHPALEDMRKRAAGGRDEILLEKLVPSYAGRLLVGLLKESGNEQGTVEDSTISTIVYDLDPDTRPGGNLLTNILHWAESRQHAEVVGGDGRTTSIKFHNLSEPVDVLSEQPKESEYFAYEALMAYLQRRFQIGRSVEAIDSLNNWRRHMSVEERSELASAEMVG